MIESIILVIGMGIGAFVAWLITDLRLLRASEWLHVGPDGEALRLVWTSKLSQGAEYTMLIRPYAPGGLEKPGYWSELTNKKNQCLATGFTDTQSAAKLILWEALRDQLRCTLPK